MQPSTTYAIEYFVLELCFTILMNKFEKIRSDINKFDIGFTVDNSSNNFLHLMDVYVRKPKEREINNLKMARRTSRNTDSTTILSTNLLP